MSGTIVCGVTQTPEARAAAQLAAALAARLDLRLVLVHVFAEHAQAPGTAGMDDQTRVERAIGTVAHELGHRVEVRVVSGHRADGLARVAADEGADLIVVGSRQGGARGRRLRYTLARELEATTDVPVLIAPPSTRSRSGLRLALAEVPPGR